MDKIKQKILADYKKANKAAKERILKKYEFSSEMEFLNYLTGFEEKKEDSGEVQPIDMVVAFDTTGSMGAYIESVRTHVQDLIGELFKNTPNLRMKIVAFGDYCDMQSASNFGKAYQFTQLTDNEQDLISFVQKAENTHGGDGDEFYELVIKKIVEETEWRNGKKSVLLIGDAEPHPVGYSYSKIVKNAQIDWRQEAQKAAEKGIQFDTLKIHAHINWYSELSKITGGVSMDFKNSEKINEIITGLTYARGSKEMFTTTYASVVKSGDSELIGAYKSMTTLL